MSVHMVCPPHPRAAGSLIGQGISNFVTDWDKISATVSYKYIAAIDCIHVRTYVTISVKQNLCCLQEHLKFPVESKQFYLQLFWG